MDVTDLATVEGARTRRLRVIEAVAVMGMTHAEAAAYANVSKKSVSALLAHEKVQQYIKDLQEAHAKRLNVGRERVIEGMLEAIEHAKQMNEPATQIRGWEAIAKMQGHNAPERHVHELPEETQRMLATMQNMTDDQVAKLADMDGVVELRPGIDFKEVDNG